MTDTPHGGRRDTPYKPKLIEVAIPLEDINKESAREKSIRHGHPSTLHLWWSRKPLATARAVLFAQLVDDPSAHPEEFPTEETQATERERLFDVTAIHRRFSTRLRVAARFRWKRSGSALKPMHQTLTRSRY